MMRFRACMLLLWIISLGGCLPEAAHHVTPAIYYWKTVYAPTAYEQTRWQQAGIRRVYLRCFDIVTDASGAPRPAGIIRNLPGAEGRLLHIPVVFITQDVLQSMHGADCRPLAGNISRLLQQLLAGLPPPDEIQIDCDWTTTTQETYFQLLHALRNEPYFRGKALSATIRLHQVKYRLRAGIPPVDRGLLMCYNMGNLKRPGRHNSILDPGTARSYLKDLERYPLPLDVALPLFRWSLHFRAGKLQGILRDVPPETVQDSPVFRETGGNLFTCIADTVLQGYPIRAGDDVRVEIPEYSDILELAAYTAKHIRNDSLRVMLFHSDSLTLAKYPPDEIEAIYGTFR